MASPRISRHRSGLTAFAGGLSVAVSGLLAGFLAVLLAVLLPGACTYSPNIESGRLSCSDRGECPRGFTCSLSGKCVTGGGTGLIGGGPGGSPGGLPDGGGIGIPGTDGKVDLRFDAPPIDIGPIDINLGSGGSGAGGASGTGGRPDAGPPSTIAASYLGTWVFDTGAYIYTDCGPDYQTTTDSLAGATLAIYTTATTDILGASWSPWPACTYELYLDSLGLHLNNTNWACEYTAEDPTVYWVSDAFDVATSNGLTGNHDAYYIEGFFYADGKTVYCDQLVHASLTKR